MIHPIRNTFRFASRKYLEEMSRDLRPVYTAPSTVTALKHARALRMRHGEERTTSGGPLVKQRSLAVYGRLIA